ncbi:heavy-metal-associated domain-containing protein [Tropicimonas sp. TH_r6]|uniref:heavy-metal-associated domain-containing protein n=1 Tax=Tropicimonas sp. TH_r6 TaxID=3082085 RepID=UPI002955D61D|nr:heavy-metal-associated domain-containing protein [Tropicimonas sp. TH_r6]MDV7144470.1 heavy-metal-associated domain-containing protein [Tropicimonas sp. TH_r6]
MKFNVPDMSCGHCTAAIEKAILEAESGAKVACDIDSRTVTVECSLSPESITTILLEAGYKAKTIE